MEYYQYPIKELFQSLQTQATGLTGEEAQTRITKYGPNKLAEEEKTSRLKIFFRQFTSPRIYIFLLAVVITAFLKQIVDSGLWRSIKGSGRRNE